MKYLILLLALAGCSSGFRNLSPGWTTAESRALVHQFEQDFNILVLYEVVFVKKFSFKVSQYYIGICYTDGFYKRVEILEKFQNRQELAPIIYHELGHCSLELDHWNEDFDIMNSGLWDEVEDEFQYYREQMIYNYEHGVY